MKLLANQSANLLCTVLLIVGIGAVSVKAQKSGSFSTNGFWQPASPPFSPQVLGDGSVRFRIKGKQAQSVQLHFGEWNIVPKEMTKDADGVWSVTIDPVEPGIYSYLFTVDGVRTADLANPVIKRGTELYGSIVEIKGKEPGFDQYRTVPQGVLHEVRYQSTALDRQVNMVIYLPPNYLAEPKKKFPLLCLRHGGGDTETSWTQESGRANVILDNLIAEKKAVPMIMVMPYGLTDGSWAGGSNKEGMEALEKELMQDIIPYIEKNYRVLPGKQHRAIAGLSMGGGQAYVMGLRNLASFSWIGEFSSGLLSDPEFRIEERAPGIFDHPSNVNNALKLLWIGCGTDDPRIGGHQKMVEQLKARGINHRVLNIPGGHEWKVWRVQLQAFLQELFK